MDKYRKADGSGNALTRYRPLEPGIDDPNVGETTGFVNQWLDQAVRLYEQGALHPSVMKALAPQIDAMVQSDNRRHGMVSDDPRLDNPNAAVSPYGRTPAQYVRQGKNVNLQGGVPPYANEEDYGPAAADGDPYNYMRRK